MECFLCQSEMSCLYDDHTRVCTKCGYTFDFPTAPSPTSFETQVLTKPFMYKREHHFMNWLKRLQAQDTRTLPEELVELVKNSECKTLYQIRQLLKKNHYSKYYNCIPSILARLQHVPSTLTVAQEKLLVNDFLSVELAFHLVKDQKRKNMMPYGYILHKLFHIHNIHLNFLIRLSRNHNTINSYDRVWKKICFQLGWTYHPTTLHLEDSHAR
jgi:hypothetical protein